MSGESTSLQSKQSWAYNRPFGGGGLASHVLDHGKGSVLVVIMNNFVIAGQGGRELYVHANRAAPRCLPCNYTDPAELAFENPAYQYKAPRVGALACCFVYEHCDCTVTCACPAVLSKYLPGSGRARG